MLYSMIFKIYHAAKINDIYNLTAYFGIKYTKFQSVYSSATAKNTIQNITSQKTQDDENPAFQFLSDSRKYNEAFLTHRHTYKNCLL